MAECETCFLQPRESVHEGDWLKVREEMFCRSGEYGEVLSADTNGCGLDFYTSHVARPDYISIEFWEWGELEICNCQRPDA